MIKMQQILSVLIPMAFVPGLVNAQGFSEHRPEPQECGVEVVISDGPVRFLWEAEGHMYTTGAVADIAGFEGDAAGRLAYFSQAPDDIWFQYSATSVAFWGIVQPHYRHLIVAILHSLHGGDSSAVMDRRRLLAEEVAMSVKDPNWPEWKTGFLIHALGDSYAHVIGNSDDQSMMHAYGEGVGHAFDNLPWGRHPDEISAKGVFVNYQDYVRALYHAICKENCSDLEIDKFINHVRSAAETGNEQKVACAITYYDKNGGGYLKKIVKAASVKKSSVDELKKEIKRSQVRQFLDGLQGMLECGH